MLFIDDIKRKQALYISDGAECSFGKALMTDGTGANLLYRLMQWSAKHRLKPLAYIFQLLNKFLNGCLIGIGSDFGKGLVIAHPIGIVINSKVKGGNNITIESGVVIGDEKGRSPTLGDDVFVGAGAKIVGNVTIGNNVKIGANAVVVKSAEDNVTLVGIPARALRPKPGNHP